MRKNSADVDIGGAAFLQRIERGEEFQRFLAFAQKDSSPRSGPYLLSSCWIECAQTHFAPVLLFGTHARVRSEHGI